MVKINVTCYGDMLIKSERIRISSMSREKIDGYEVLYVYGTDECKKPIIIVLDIHCAQVNITVEVGDRVLELGHDMNVACEQLHDIMVNDVMGMV